MSDHDTPTSPDTPGDDPTVAPLRKGLDALADPVGREPPGLGDVAIAPAGSSRRPNRWLLGAAAAVVAVGAGVVIIGRGDDDPQMESSSTKSVDPSTVIATATAPPVTGGSGPSGEPQRYRAVATVLEDDGHGPQLCLGAVAESYPPQCGGLDITNWTWDDVQHEPQQPNDPDLGVITTKWGEYVVVGTYDPAAQTFTLTERARSAKPSDYEQQPELDLSTPCEEPDGGWATTSEAEVTSAAERIAQANQSDDGTAITEPPATDDGWIARYGGLWQSSDPLALNVAVAAPGEGDEGFERHPGATIRTFYAGPLCIVPATSSLAELQHIQDEITADAQSELSSVGVDVPLNKVVVELPAPNAELERDLAERYGDAVRINVTGLVPIEPAVVPGTTVPTSTGATEPGASGSTEYRTVGFVLEDDNHGPQLCFGSDHSYPPQCEGIDITNWNWDDLKYEGGNDAAEPTTARWGDYVVVGTYDADANTFSLTRPARTAKQSDYREEPERDDPTPCDEPEGGWPAATEVELADAASTIDPSPGAAGTAIVDGMGGIWIARDPFVLNVAVTGDVDAAETTIREVYDGPLCVVPAKYTEQELEELSVEIYRANEGTMVSTNTDVVRNRVEVALLAPDSELEAGLAEEYGDAVAVVGYAFEPVDGAGTPGSATPNTGEPNDASETTVPAVELPSPGGPDTPVTSPVLD